MSTTRTTLPGRWAWDQSGTIARWAWEPPAAQTVIDTTYSDGDPRRRLQGQRHSFRCIVRRDSDGWWTVTTCGGARGGTRHRYVRSLDDAIEIAESWLSRRYRLASS